MTAKVLIVGAGAIGGFYGALLARSGADVSLVCRTDYDLVRRQGLKIQSPLGAWNFEPVRVLRSATECGEAPDYLVLCVKVLEGLDRAALIREAAGPETAIVLIENGIDIEQEIAGAFPDNLLISGLAFICASRPEPGVVSHTAYGRLTVGDYPRGLSDRTRAFASLFDDSGVHCVCTEDVVAARWQKCVWNAPFNPVSVLSGGLDTHAILLQQEAFIRAIMEEVCLIARSQGHPLREDIVEINLDSTLKMPPYKTSMLLDFEAGLPLETEAILGNTVRAGRQAGVPIPYLESLYSLMKLRKTGLQSASS